MKHLDFDSGGKRWMGLCAWLVAFSALSFEGDHLQMRSATLRVPPGDWYEGQVILVEVVARGSLSTDRLEVPQTADFLVAGPITRDRLPSSADQSETRWEVPLLASRSGRRRLPPFRVTSGVESLATASREIVVRAPPIAGRPREFLGGVGRLDARARVDHSQITLGDTFRLRIELTGPGAAGTSRPILPELPLARVRDQDSPTRIEEKASKVHVYEIRPLRAGELTILPIRIAWFDPISKRYQTTVTNSVRVQVKAQVPAIPRVSPALPDVEPGSWRRSAAWGILGAIAALGAVFAIIRGVQYRSASLRSFVRRRGRLLRSTGDDAHFATIFMSTLAEICRRCDVQPPVVLTPPEVREFLRSRGVAEPIAAKAVRLISDCDRVLYSGQDSSKAWLLDRERYLQFLATLPDVLRETSKSSPRSIKEGTARNDPGGGP